MNEREQSVAIANKVLDRPHADPDDDIAILARQLLRREEEIVHLKYSFGELRKVMA